MLKFYYNSSSFWSIWWFRFTSQHISLKKEYYIFSNANLLMLSIEINWTFCALMFEGLIFLINKNEKQFSTPEKKNNWRFSAKKQCNMQTLQWLGAKLIDIIILFLFQNEPNFLYSVRRVRTKSLHRASLFTLPFNFLVVRFTKSSLCLDYYALRKICFVLKLR